MRSYEEILNDLGLQVRVRRAAPFILHPVTGPDAREFLHRLCSQDLLGMAEGECRPAAFLTPKGKLLCTTRMARAGDTVWIETHGAEDTLLGETLERYHFTENLSFRSAAGLRCAEAIGTPEGTLPPPGLHALGSVVILASDRQGQRIVRAFGPEAEIAAWSAAIPGEELSEPIAECLRILRGEVRIGLDTDPGTLAMEAGLADHISFTKGCYVGQEIVARIQTYGHVNRRLVLLGIEGADAVAPGAELLEPEEREPVGRVQTSAVLPDGTLRVALGYLPKEFWTEGTRLLLAAPEPTAVQVLGFSPA
ncbi:MAG: hypothetical protein IT458_01280 [Planctomycetes bacterium]|nr:hypothetical protein [Planctomycetota bacterium]